jgi:radical SAM superfamily enzyme YgiQ (UPF0313 family)
MRVLLVSANTLTEPYPVYPLGLDYVAGAIAADHQVQIADLNSLGNEGSLGKIIRDFSPDVIGISLRNIDNTDTTAPRGFIGQYREIVTGIRHHSKALIILGGSGFTLFPAEIMAALRADFGIVGEGEHLARLLNAIASGEDVTPISGVITRDTLKARPIPWNKPFVRHFSANPSQLGYYLKNGGMLNLQTKRGCHYKCIYCTYPHIEGRHHRRIAPQDVADTARRLQAAGAKFLFMTDSAFNSDYSHNIAVAREFKKASVSIPWGAFFAPIKPPVDYFRRLAAAGLTHVEFGTDSLSNSVLAAYRKPFRAHHVLDAHEAAVEAGLHVAHYFLLGGPGETAATLKETIAGVNDLRKSVLFFFCGMRIYPNTALYDLAVAEGQIAENDNILEPVFFRSASIAADEIIRLLQAQARNRLNWVIGAGGSATAGVVAKLHERGHSGPLWEYLIR